MLSIALAAALTGEQIFEKWSAFAGLQKPAASTSATMYTYTNNGLTTNFLVVTKAPNKYVESISEPWRNLSYQRGYDGHTAWVKTNPGSSGLAGMHDRDDILAKAAYYVNQKGGTLTRVDDFTFQGYTYYAVREDFKDARSQTLFFDRSTFYNVGSTDVPGRIDMCDTFVRVRGVLGCAKETWYRDGAIVGGSTNRDVDIGPIEDWQFEAPQEITDDTTPLLYANFRQAMHGDIVPKRQRYRGTRTSYFGYARRGDPWYWDLTAVSPASFTLADSSSAYTFDGNYADAESGTPEGARHFRDATMGLAYNQCALHHPRCGVFINREANVRIGDKTFYAIKVTSNNDPAVFYTLLLDEHTYLPRAVVLAYQIVVRFDDYATTDAGLPYPTKWTYFYNNVRDEITGVHPVDSLP